MEEEALLKRVLPHSIEAEQSVIGSMLMDKDAVIVAMDILNRDDFYSISYGAMYEAMVELFNEGKPMDMVLLQNKLREKGLPPEVGSLESIKALYELIPTSANIRSYAQIVHDKAVLRRLIKVNEEIANACYVESDSVDGILAKTEKDIFNLLQNKGSAEFTPIGEIARTVFEQIEAASRTKETVTGVPTGFVDLDYKTSGFHASDLVLIAARPSMGKTAFVLNIVHHVATRKQLPCMIFSLEMSKEQLMNRMLSMESRIDAQSLRTGDLTDNDWEDLLEGVVNVSRSKLVIDDTPGISIAQLRSKCRKMKLEQGLEIVIIDYLQLMTSGSKRSDSRQQEISDISRSLKALARELECPVVALSQLSRACETRPDHRPMLSDLRESGAIEQDADIVMFLYRDDYYNKDTEHPNEAEVIIAKQRNGPIGTVRLVWRPETTRFENMERLTIKSQALK